MSPDEFLFWDVVNSAGPDTLRKDVRANKIRQVDHGLFNDDRPDRFCNGRHADMF